MAWLGLDCIEIERMDWGIKSCHVSPVTTWFESRLNFYPFSPFSLPRSLTHSLVPGPWSLPLQSLRIFGGFSFFSPSLTPALHLYALLLANADAHSHPHLSMSRPTGLEMVHSTAASNQKTISVGVDWHSPLAVKVAVAHMKWLDGRGQRWLIRDLNQWAITGWGCLLFF